MSPGPETFTFEELLRLIRHETGSRVAAASTRRRAVALLAARSLSPILGDVLITSEEMEGLLAGVLVSHQPPLGRRRFSEWLHESAPWLGRRYLSGGGAALRHWCSPRLMRAPAERGTGLGTGGPRQLPRAGVFDVYAACE